MAKVALNERSIRREAPATGQIELWDAYTPGFGLRIAAGGARTYCVLRRVNGKKVRRTVGKAHIGDGPPVEGELLLPDARKMARLMLGDLQRGIDVKGVAALRAEQEAEAASTVEALIEAPAARTFAAVATKYFADQSKQGGGKLRSKKELERKVKIDLAAWRDLPIDAITRRTVRALIEAKAEKAPVSANRLLALVRRILRWAARKEIIDANPATDIDPPTEETERERVLTMSELARVWGGAGKLGYPFGPIISLLILTAQRRAEVGEMRWQEIDGNAWRVPDGRAKRAKGHLVPLSAQAASILAAQPKVGDRPALVFTTGRRRKPPPAGEKPTPAPVAGWSRVKTRLDKIIAEQAAKAADEPLDLERHALPAWTLHDIRRSVATHLRDGDVMGKDRVDRLVVSKLLNHSEGGMTRLYDRYSADPEQRAALEAWGCRIEELVGLRIPPEQK